MTGHPPPQPGGIDPTRDDDEPPEPRPARSGAQTARHRAPRPPRRAGPAGPVWLWPALLTLGVTATGVGRAQPWRDELATWSAATRPLDDLVRLAGTIDATTGPYYLLMHGWVDVFGDSAVALRAPAVAAMTAAAALTAVLGERLFDRWAGLLAGLLFAVLPSTSRYGQEARPYALATLFAVLATLLLVDALRRPGAGRFTGYAVAVTALGLAHLVALTVLAAHAVAVLTTRGGRRLRWWLPALVPAALVLTPLVLVARGQRSRQLSWVDPARWTDLAAVPGGITRSAVVGGLLLGLAAVGAAGRGRWGVVLLLSALLPALLLFAAGLVTPIWVPRYLVFTAPFLCLAAGALLGSVRLLPALLVITLTAALGLPEQAALRHTHDWPPSARVDYRAAARIVAAGQRPGDAVVYSPRDSFLFLDLGLAYHLGRDRPRDVLVVSDQRAAADFWARECPDPTRCLTGVRRVWLVVAGRTDDPVATLPPAKGTALRDGFTRTARWQVPGITVALLTR